ncbi:MAG: radical SAM protein, partial [Cyanobacteria bacterium NC_groundwater_1444_Ag_S-0.65um_54_12]|nr:radical SAM protein [Cyanobacteria bacterium NC_groundwater_1444_Ag_S-0.65um_54_12]
MMGREEDLLTRSAVALTPSRAGGQDKDYTYFTTTSGMCRQCRKVVRAQVIFQDGKVYLERICPEHGSSRALIAASSEWYLDAIRQPMVNDRPRVTTTPVRNGCPHDCGLCPWHEQRCHLPVFSITNACNLECPICFTYNRKDKRYFKSPEEMRTLVDWIIEATGGVDLINITGGEPTLHPGLIDLIKIAKRKEIGRITLNSNGITLARNEDLVKQLKELDVYIILSLDTFLPDRSVRIHGRDITSLKLQALEMLKKWDVPTTLLHVMINGVNDDELPDILELAFGEDFIRSLTIQTMTYTGFGGRNFGPREHLPVDGVEALIERATAGKIRQSDFMPLPSAHPLCYGICYLFGRQLDELVPFLRLMEREQLREFLTEGYLLHPKEGFDTALKEGIDRLWACGESSANQLRTM